MKFYLDEHVDPRLGDLLRSEGFKVFYMKEEGEGEPDSFHLERSKSLEACIVTRDDDFLSMISGQDHEGVFFLTDFSRPEEVFEEIKSYTVEDLGRNFVVYI
ncbi:MAG: DUF5615 family PIN-like protein [Candidatus Nanohaloarchaea archaeon]